jgi:DNA-binding MarR family transcriptional regulator
MDPHTIHQFRKNLRKLARKLTGPLQDDALCCGVTTAQCHVLLVIEEKGLTTGTELAAELALDKSTLSRTIDGLVAAGLVSRETNAGNRRRQQISLTREGQKVTAGINDQAMRYFESLFARIPEPKQAEVLEGISILSAIIPEDCCDIKGQRRADSVERRGERTAQRG